jgi:hypothetical protein
VTRVAVALSAVLLLVLTACSNSPFPTDPVPEPNPPKAPTNVTAVAGDGEVDLSWTAPPLRYNERNIEYTVTSSEGDVITTNSTATTFTGLTNGTIYTFTVSMSSSFGESPESEPSEEVTPGPQ